LGMTHRWYHGNMTVRCIGGYHIPPEFGIKQLPILHIIILSASLLTGLDY